MKTRLAALPLALLAGTSACGGPPFDARLEPLSTAPLQVGHGLGPLVLGETTLNDVLASYDVDAVSFVAGDESGFELALAGGQLDLLFPVPTEWLWDGPRPQDAMRDLPAFVAAHPEYGDLKLSSLDVSVSHTGRRLFYTGALAQGGRLTGRIADVIAGYGVPPGGPGPFVAGMSPNDSDERALYPDLGLMVHYATQEPEEEGAPPPTVIESITLFQSGAP